MKFTVIVSEEALEDIQAVFRFIAEVECLPITARRWVDSIETAIKNLDYMPYRYPRYELQIAEIAELQKLVVGRYLVLYTVDEFKHQVSVLRVISAQRDVAAVLTKSM